MTAVKFDPDRAIEKMAANIGQLSAELAFETAMKEAALERVAELEAMLADSEKPAEELRLEAEQAAT